MNISAIDYDLSLKAACVYVSGCNEPHCPGCHNSELWDFSVGSDWELWKSRLMYMFKTGMVDNIHFYGGEPLDQDNNNLVNLLFWIKSNIDADIWIFTRYGFDDVPTNIKKYLSYVKTGEYISNLKSYTDEKTGIILASKNQRIHKI